MDTFLVLQQRISRQGGLKQAQSPEITQCLLDALVDILNKGKEMSCVMKEALNKASEATQKFVKEHPVLVKVTVTLIALAILALLVPWAIEALGFGELGPVAGSWAARSQSTFPNVPAGSWFSFFQRLGMKLGTKMWGMPFFLA